MKVQIAESGTWRRTLEIEVPPEDVKKRLDEALKSYGKSLNLPGFRKGKVPIGFVKARFGKAILEEVLQKLEEETYREASISNGLEPISEATIEERDYTEGECLRFKASVEVKPTPDITNYKDARVTRPVFKVEDDDVEDQLHLLQEQNATERVVDRPLELGDVLVADIQELDTTGVPIIGTKQDNRSFWIGAPRSTNHDLDNQLLGIAVDQERRVRLAQTAGSSDPSQADREVRLLFTAREVRERTLPDLDDEFSKDFGDFDSLDAFRTRIREGLQAQADGVSRRRLQENLLDALIRENDFELPDSMVDNYLDNVIDAYKKETEGDDQSDIDEDAVRRDHRDDAVRSVRRYIILDSIAKQEEIEATEEDLNQHLEGLAQRRNIDASRLRQALSRSGDLKRIESDLVEMKTFDFLIEHARIDDVEEAVEER